MTAIEAYKALKIKKPLLPISRCIEYDSLFVFQAYSKTSEAIGNLYSVDKKTGKVGIFIPPMISKEEYDKGIEVKLTNKEAQND